MLMVSLYFAGCAFSHIFGSERGRNAEKKGLFSERPFVMERDLSKYPHCDNILPQWAKLNPACLILLLLPLLMLDTL